MVAKARVVVLTSTFPRWRNDTQPSFVFDLCQRLRDEFRITVVAPHAAGAAEREVFDGLEVVRYRYASDSREQLCYGSGMLANLRARPWNVALLPAFFRSQSKVLRDLLSTQQGPIVVHAHWLFPQGWLAAHVLAKESTPLLITAHGSDVMKLNGSFWDRMHKAALSRAQAVTSVGPEVADRLSNQLGLEAERLFLLPLGVDTEFFVPPQGRRGGDHLLFVGRLVREKGLSVLLRALPLIAEEYPSVRLTVAGDGADRVEFVNLAETLGISARVDFVGWCEKQKLRELYQQASLFVSSSEREGFGLVLAEALACGCPAVGTDLPAFRFLAGGSGAVAYCATRRENDWAATISNLLSSPEVLQCMSIAGRARAEDISAAAQAKSYARLLNRMAESSVSGRQ